MMMIIRLQRANLVSCLAEESLVPRNPLFASDLNRHLVAHYILDEVVDGMCGANDAHSPRKFLLDGRERRFAGLGTIRVTFP